MSFTSNPKTYNLKDLAQELSQNFHLTQQDGNRITRFMVDRLTYELAAGKQVRIHQLGTLTARPRRAGVARNPANGDRVVVPARKVVRLNVSPSLKKKVNAQENNG